MTHTDTDTHHTHWQRTARTLTTSIKSTRTPAHTVTLRWPSWAPVPEAPTVSVDVKQHLQQLSTAHTPHIVLWGGQRWEHFDWVLKYTICVIVYCDVVNVQPRFNFSDEIITDEVILDQCHSFIIWARCEGQSHTVYKPQPAFEEKGQPKQIRTEVPLLSYESNALPVGRNRLTVYQRFSHTPEPNSNHWFTTSFLQPLPYLVTP